MSRLIEIKDNLTRVSAKVKSGIMDAVNRTWNSINDFARSHQADYQPSITNEDNLSNVGENEALDTAITEEGMCFVSDRIQNVGYKKQSQPLC